MYNRNNKIAVLTHYNNSVNYGGVLQSFALCRVINSFGYECLQLKVDYQNESKVLVSNYSGIKKIFVFSKRVLRFFIKPLLYTFIPRYKNLRRLHNELDRSFVNFRENLIPHSTKEYSISNIKEALKDYDAFIVGSDQVWNPIWYYPPFFLTFVPSDVPKISYAASISQTALSDEVKAVYKDHLKDFIGVSIREKDAVALLSDISPVDVVHTLDPTMLLGKDEWDAVVAERVVKEQYVFCYFLGNDMTTRNAAKEYAEKKGFKLVNVTHASGLYHSNDIGYGDAMLAAPSPEEFLSLIKYAEFVFTDSFHASVFSLIYNKEFFVFERQGHKAMGSRVYSLTDMFDVGERFADTPQKATIEYIDSLTPIDYSKSFHKFEEIKQRSIEFLDESLKKAEKMLQKNEG